MEAVVVMVLPMVMMAMMKRKRNKSTTLFSLSSPSVLHFVPPFALSHSFTPTRSFLLLFFQPYLSFCHFLPPLSLSFPSVSHLHLPSSSSSPPFPSLSPPPHMALVHFGTGTRSGSAGESKEPLPRPLKTVPPPPLWHSHLCSPFPALTPRPLLLYALTYLLCVSGCWVSVCLCVYVSWCVCWYERLPWNILGECTYVCRCRCVWARYSSRCQTGKWKLPDGEVSITRVVSSRLQRISIYFLVYILVLRPLSPSQ